MEFPFGMDPTSNLVHVTVPDDMLFPLATHYYSFQFEVIKYVT